MRTATPELRPATAGAPVLTSGAEDPPARFDRFDLAVWIFLAAISYVPSFLTKPGQIAADTKQYLYLDPGRLIQSAIALWDPDVGAGTVTHQNIGFLFPLGPYYWVVAQLHIPVWIGQRFWMGSLFFAAGSGVWYLGRLLGLSRAGRLAAALTYMLTPFVIDYIARISAIVMPWAALGWMMALTILAVRRGGWRYPALFAVVVALVGGVNATSILLVGLAPFIWVIFAVWGTREVSGRAAGAAVARISVLSLGVSLWWLAGLYAEGSYGINVLKYTETIPTVASTSLASEVLRGLGYWFFYGQDKLQPWTSASHDYLEALWLIGVSFALPILCIALGLVARWRYRMFAVVLLIVGVVIAVGPYPFPEPTPFGALVKAAGDDSTIGLALRSTNRITPLVVLGLALLLGSGITAVAQRWRWGGIGLLGLAGALAAANLPALWTGNLVAANLARPSALPSYVLDAASYLNAQPHDTRVLQLPGQDFAYYRWGVTSDPVWPGLMTRPYLIRQAVPVGEAGSVNLLQALDESIQDGVFVPSTLAPIARLLSAGDILDESDVQFERFGTARPQPFWLTLNQPASALGKPVTFGTPQPYQPITYPLTDETQLAIPTGAPLPPPVAVFPVAGARSITRTEPTSAPLLVAGDGQGLVNAAGAGLLATNPAIFYSASYAHDPAGLRQQLARGAVLVLTDSNQKQLSTWGTVLDNTGFVEQANETPLVANPAEAALPVFPGAGSNTQTVAQVSGVASVRATAYGNPITNTTENQPLNAVDGNPDTAWTEGAFSPAIDESIQIRLLHPVTADRVTLLQPQTGPRNRTVTRATLTFDGGSPVTTDLGAPSVNGPGQVVSFPSRKFQTLTVTVDATSSGLLKTYQGESAVGFAEVAIPGVAPATQVLRLPTDLLATAGPASLSHQLDIVLSRIRTRALPPRSDPESSLARAFTLPTARAFSIGGSARISTLASDPVVNQLLGISGTGPAAGSTHGSFTATVVSANSSGRLPSDLAASAAAAVDGNPGTAWTPGFGPQAGSWLRYQLSQPITFDHLDLQVVADGVHSIPTEVTVSTPSGSREVALPPIAPGTGRPQGSVTPVPITFPALTGSQVSLTIDAVAPHTFLDYISNGRNTGPVALADVGIPGVAPVVTPAMVPGGCYTNLLAIDGHPVDIAVRGSTATALANGGLTITGCGNAAHGVILGPGNHVVTTASGSVAGLDLDALTLGSAAGGGALALTASGQLPAPPVATSPTVQVLRQSRTAETVTVHGNGRPFWLVLGQSQSRGWKATTSSGRTLGSSSLIDGYANGWYVPGSAAKGLTTITLTWTPQRVVDVALLASGATLLLGVVLAVGPIWRRRRSPVLDVAPAGVGKGLPAGEGAIANNVAGAAELPVSIPRRAEPFRPELTSLLRSGGHAPPWPGAIMAALVAGAVAAFVVAPVVGALTAGVVLFGMAVDRGRLVTLVALVGLLGTTALYMLVIQQRNRLVPDITWPSHFGLANTLVWLALALLGADGLVQFVRHRRAP